MSPARLWLFIRLLLLCPLTIGAAGLGCTTVAPQHPRVAPAPTTAQSPGVEAAPPFSSPPSATREAQARGALASLTLPFLRNDGQSDARVAYYAPTFAGTVFVTHEGEIVYSIGEARQKTPSAEADKAPRRAVLTEKLLNATPIPHGGTPSVTNRHYRV